VKGILINFLITVKGSKVKSSNLIYNRFLTIYGFARMYKINLTFRVVNENRRFNLLRKEIANLTRRNKEMALISVEYLNLNKM
jgi:hypothetical protein